MYQLLELQGAGTLDNLCVGVGDLYVTVYGGRTRLVGILLGRGLDVDEAQAELKGVTLESLVVARRVARAIRIRAEAGALDLARFPLLMHIDDIPWPAMRRSIFPGKRSLLSKTGNAIMDLLQRIKHLDGLPAEPLRR